MKIFSVSAFSLEEACSNEWRKISETAGEIARDSFSKREENNVIKSKITLFENCWWWKFVFQRSEAIESVENLLWTLGWGRLDAFNENWQWKTRFDIQKWMAAIILNIFIELSWRLWHKLFKVS